MPTEKRIPKLTDVYEIVSEKELEHLPPVDQMDDLGLEILLGKIIGRTGWLLDRKEIEIQYVHKGIGFIKDACEYFRSPKKKDNILGDVSYLESRLGEDISNATEFVDNNNAAASFFAKAYSAGAASIQRDKNATLKETSWGENGNSDTLVGNPSDLFNLAMGYLKEGIYKSADDKKEATESISMANNEFDELSALLKNPSSLDKLSKQYAQFLEEVKGLGFDIENHLPVMKKRLTELYRKSDKEPASHEEEIPSNNPINSLFNEFYSTAFNSLNYKHLFVGDDEAEQQEIAAKILGAYVNGLSYLSECIKASKDHIADDNNAEGNLSKIEERFSKNGIDINDFKSSIIRKLADSREIPVLYHYAAGKLGNYDTNLAWHILKNCIPGFKDAEDTGFENLSSNIDKEDSAGIVSRAMNFANFGYSDNTPFKEKIGKSFSYINKRLNK
jgi:hypothetical protein